jgi:hypothetical protein
MDPFSSTFGQDIFTSTSSAGGFGGGFGSRSVSTSTRIINGQKHTVTEINDENVNCYYYECTLRRTNGYNRVPVSLKNLVMERNVSPSMESSKSNQNW